MAGIKLEIPFDKKNWAKAEAWSAGGKLKWVKGPEWVFEGKSLPQSLDEFRKGAPKSKRHLTGLDVPFELREFAQDLGARWNPEAQCYVCEGEVTPELARFAAEPLTFEWWQGFLAGGRRPQASDFPADLSAERPEQRKHQKEAETALSGAFKAGAPAFLLADEVGLGKTYSAIWGLIAAVRLWKATKKGKAERPFVLIVSPLSVVPHWRRSIQALDAFSEMDIMLINYDRLQKLFDKKDAKSRKGVARKGTLEIKADFVVFDESHKLKNLTSARSKLGRKISATADFCLYLSATAGQTPLELGYLSDLLAWTTGSRASALKDFEEWCKGYGLGVKRGAFGKWEWSGDEADCAKVERLLFGGKETTAIRRRPQEIAGWPEISRQIVPVSLSGSRRKAYETEWSAFKSVWHGQGGGVSIEEAAKKKASGIGSLVESLRYRQKSSLLRIDETVELVCDLLENGKRVAISVAFKETMEAIRAKLEKAKHKVALIHGSQSPAEKESERVAFQTGKADVCIFTVEEGINLHEGEMMKNDKPRAMVIHDLRWSAIQMAQIEGRTHRDGKFSPIYWMAFEGSIDEKIAVVLAKRIGAMKGMSGDGLAVGRDIAKAIEEAFAA